MAVKYLDNAGTQYLVNKIKAIDGKIPTESQITTMITNALNTYKEGIVTIVESLPQTGEEGKLYLVLDPSDSDVYIIYTWEENAFKRMGSKTFTLTVDSTLSSTSTNPVQNKVIKSALDGKANSSHTHGSITNDGKLGTASRVVITGTDKKIGISTVTTTELGYLSGVTSAIQTQLNSKSATGHTHTAGDVAGLATVATTGSYNDLSDKPSINNATLTIQKNGSTVKTFTANASSNVTCNITVPTSTSDLINDSNFVDTSNSAVASGITSAKVTSYDSHIADNDIHVTTADKTSWNTVTSKANDSDVVHKSGNETVGGVKTFSDNTYITSLNFTNNVESPSSSSGSVLPLVNTITYTSGDASLVARLNFRITANGDKSLYPHENNQYSLGVNSRRWTTLYGYFANLGGTYVGDEASANERTNLCLLANRDTDGLSGAYIGRFRQNRAQGAMSGGDVSFISLDFLENSTRYTRCFTMGLTDWDSDGVPQTYYFTAPNGKGVLGTSYARWNKVYADEYYYGSANTEFSNKFVTTDTNQTISGNKTFSGGTAFNSWLYFTNSSVTKGTIPQSTSNPYRIYFGSGVNYANSLFNIDTTVSNTGAQFFTFRSAENVINGDDTRLVVVYDPNLTQPRYISVKGNFLPNANNTYDIGSSSAYWRNTYTKLVNGLNPSSLGMPDLANGVDISSYITVVANANKESLYTPPANGWISVRLSRTSGALGVLLIQGGMASSGKNIEVESGATTADAMLPVVGGVQVSINSALADGIVSAYFYPCQGNV